jgi:hypothetical protein
VKVSWLLLRRRVEWDDLSDVSLSNEVDRLLADTIEPKSFLNGEVQARRKRPSPVFDFLDPISIKESSRSCMLKHYFPNVVNSVN